VQDSAETFDCRVFELAQIRDRHQTEGRGEVREIGRTLITPAPPDRSPIAYRLVKAIP
jgi:hypothetical protein